MPVSIWKSCFSVSGSLRRLPRACDLRRDDPQQRRAPRAAVGPRLGLVGRPALHAERVRHDAAAGLQVEELRPELVHVARQEEQRHHVGLRDVRLVHVALDERSLCRERRLAAAFRFDSSTMSGLYSTPSAVRAALGRRDDVAPVAGAEVHDVVLRRHLRHIEHLLDQLRRRRHPDDVLAFLADRRLERCGLLRRCHRGEGSREHERQGDTTRVDTDHESSLPDGGPHATTRAAVSALPAEAEAAGRSTGSEGGKREPVSRGLRACPAPRSCTGRRIDGRCCGPRPLHDAGRQSCSPPAAADPRGCPVRRCRRTRPCPSRPRPASSRRNASASSAA